MSDAKEKDRSKEMGADFVPEFGPQGALRQDCGYEGRIHIDRPLPFIVLNRYDPDDEHSLAKRIAVTSSAYAVWPAEQDDDKAAVAALEAVLTKQREHCGSILLISIYDRKPSEKVAPKQSKLPEFTACIGATDEKSAQAAAKALANAIEGIRVDLRNCKVDTQEDPYHEPGIAELCDRMDGLSHISLGLPQNYKRPDGEGIYPQLFQDLAVDVFDALLKAAHAFMHAADDEQAPEHHRSLARSSFLDIAQSVDEQIDEVGRRFDFLLSVSPINTQDAFETFRNGDYDAEPTFRYRPLTVDPDIAKRDLYSIDFAGLESPMLETLFSEKRLEIDHQLTMLQSRNTPNFRYTSMLLYGTVENELLDDANAILASKRPKSAGGGNQYVDCKAVEKGARELVESYRQEDERFDVNVELREDIAAGLMVSGNTVMISTSTRMPAKRLEPLLHHEISVHALTWVNGAQQGLRMFRSGLAGYEGVQEGLGVFAEWAVNGLTWVRLRALAARVVVVDAMIEGASFIEAFRLLHDKHGFSDKGAFNIVARVYRSGGFAKDVIYLRGLKTVLDVLGSGGELTPYWYGKIAPHHVGVIEEFALRGLLTEPLFTPAFLSRDDVRDRISSFRDNPSLSSII